MKAKDKAVDLVDKYLECVTGGCRLLDDLCQDEAKQSAIIEVEEIIKTLQSLKVDIFSIGISCQYTDKKIGYWIQVKEEIEKL